MRQIYTVATLIRLYSVHTASVFKPVLYKYTRMVYGRTAVILHSTPRRSVSRGGVFKRMENENGECEMKMKMASSDRRVYLFGRGTAVVRSGTSSVVPVFHLTAHTATLVLFRFCSTVLFLFLFSKLEVSQLASGHLSVAN